MESRFSDRIEERLQGKGGGPDMEDRPLFWFISEVRGTQP